MELYLNTYGSYLHKKGSMFEIKVGDEKKKISAQRISSIIISSATTLSTDAIQLAMDNNIDIVFLNQYGDPCGRVWFPKFGSTVFIRRKLLEIHCEDRGLEFIKHWVNLKMTNQINFIQLLLSKRIDKQEDFKSVICSMQELQSKMNSITEPLSQSSATLMAYEGNVSRYYFRTLSQLLPEKYHFKKRSSRPAEDPFNAFLNYGYGILYSKVERALIIAGLDPYIGLLHTDNYNKKSLVFDFIEPYRILIEQPVFYLFSRKKISEAHCRPLAKGVAIADDGKKLLVPYLMEHFDKTIRHGNRNIKQIEQIQMNAHAFANYLIGKRKTY